MNNTEICTNCKFFKNSTHYCRCLEKETSCKDSCGSFEFYKPIDWEQRRYEIAKGLLLMYSKQDNDFSISFCEEDRKRIALAIANADALIEELKKTSK